MIKKNRQNKEANKSENTAVSNLLMNMWKEEEEEEEEEENGMNI